MNTCLSLMNSRVGDTFIRDLFLIFKKCTGTHSHINISQWQITAVYMQFHTALSILLNDIKIMNGPGLNTLPDFKQRKRNIHYEGKNGRILS